MKKLICLASVFAVIGLSAFVGSSVNAADEKAPSIKKVMKLYKGKTSEFATLKTQISGDSPDWATIKKVAKDLHDTGVTLPEAKAPKGDQAGFEKLAKAHAANVKALLQAAEKEDLAGVKSACGKIGGSCMACHKSHRK
jgi:cytochrome c556